MRKWHDTERRKAAERRAKAAAAPSTVCISKRPGEGGRGDKGGVLPQRLRLGLAIIVLKFVGLPMAVAR